MPTLSRVQTKVSLILIIILTITVGANNLIGGYFFEQQYSALLEDKILVIGDGLKTQLDRILALGIPVQNLVGFEAQCREVVENNRSIGIRFAYVVDEQGVVLFHSDQGKSNRLLRNPRIQEAMRSGQKSVRQTDQDDVAFTSAIIPFRDSSGANVAGAIVIGMDNEAITAWLTTQMKHSFLLTVGFLVLSFFLIMAALSRWVTTPLAHLSRHMGEVAAGNLKTSIGATSHDEIGQLGRTFNNMVRQIEELLSHTARTAELEARYEAERGQRVDAEEMRKVILKLSSTLDVAQVTESSLAGLRELITLQQAALWLMEDGALRLKAALPGRESLAEAPVQEVFERLKAGELPVLRTEHGRSYLYMPIVIHNQLDGLFMAWNDTAYSEHDISLALTYASQVGVFIQNAQLYGQMQVLATTDALTGIYNRRHFFTQANREFERAGRDGLPQSIIMFDIDHFKRVNDLHGHPAGDRVLASVARCVAQQVWDLPHVLGRYGGEEFVVMLTGVPQGRVGDLAEGIRVAVSELAFPVDSDTLRVTLSIGVSGRSARTETLEHLLRDSDHALYAAKAAGRNRVVVTV